MRVIEKEPRQASAGPAFVLSRRITRDRMIGSEKSTGVADILLHVRFKLVERFEALLVPQLVQKVNMYVLPIDIPVKIEQMHFEQRACSTVGRCSRQLYLLHPWS